MLDIANITDDSNQLHTIPYFDSEIVIELLFSGVVLGWFLNVSYDSKNVNGLKLSLGTLHMRSNNLPFDFAVVDMIGSGFDPYQQDDFLNERYKLILLEADDMEERRGFPVEIR